MRIVGSAGVPALDATFVSDDYPTVMVSGEQAVVYLEFENNSNITWGLDETRVGTQMPADRESGFFVADNWLSPSRTTGADHSTYGPGDVGRFTFLIQAPEVDEETNFVEHFQLVQEGADWFGPIVAMNITVKPKGETGDETDPNPKDDTLSDDPEGEDPVAPAGCGVGGSAPLGGCAIVAIGALLLGFGHRRRRRLR